jgi:hypothetical protein
MTFPECVQSTPYSGDHLQGPYRSANLPHNLKMQRQERFHKWFQTVHVSVAVFSESSITGKNTTYACTQLYITFGEKTVSALW